MKEKLSSLFVVPKYSFFNGEFTIQKAFNKEYIKHFKFNSKLAYNRYNNVYHVKYLI